MSNITILFGAIVVVIIAVSAYSYFRPDLPLVSFTFNVPQEYNATHVVWYANQNGPDIGIGGYANWNSYQHFPNPGTVTISGGTLQSGDYHKLPYTIECDHFSAGTKITIHLAYFVKQFSDLDDNSGLQTTPIWTLVGFDEFSYEVVG
jgi:hypothetical protein